MSKSLCAVRWVGVVVWWCKPIILISLDQAEQHFLESYLHFWSLSDFARLGYVDVKKMNHVVDELRLSSHHVAIVIKFQKCIKNKQCGQQKRLHRH